MSVHEIFKIIKMQNLKKFDISVSYIEIYNESINDLIEPVNKNLEVRESTQNGVFINRLCEKKVQTFE
jgi:Kinesin motor domain